MQKIKHTFLNVLAGSEFSSRRLALMEAKSVRKGPTVWLTGVIHGDEADGLAIIHEVFRRIKHRPLRCGSLYSFPLANQAGFETVSRHLPLTDEDLNRCFPGDKNGSFTQRLAAAIFNAIIKTKPALVVDLHNDWINSVPYVLIDLFSRRPPDVFYKRSIFFAQKTGFLTVKEEEKKENDYLRKTLSGSLLCRRIPAVTLEFGGFYTVNEKNVEVGVRAIWNILSALKMVEPFYSRQSLPVNLQNRVLRYSEKPFSSTSGIARFLVSPGEIVKKNQPFARIYDVFGKLQETLRAGNKSVVLGYADSSVAFPGRTIAAFGVIN